jgi:hypothetical protein
MTNGKRKRMMTLLLLFCLLLIFAIGAQMWASLYRQRAIEYDQRFITPTPYEVCIGDEFTYPVDITVERANSVSSVTEGWCRDDGICPRSLQSPPVSYNFVATYQVSTTARRVVPETLTPGGWELRHCNETHSAGGVFDVACYAVQVTVKDCQP